MYKKPTEITITVSRLIYLSLALLALAHVCVCMHRIIIYINHCSCLLAYNNNNIKHLCMTKILIMALNHKCNPKKEIRKIET